MRLFSRKKVPGDTAMAEEPVQPPAEGATAQGASPVASVRAHLTTLCTHVDLMLLRAPGLVSGAACVRYGVWDESTPQPVPFHTSICVTSRPHVTFAPPARWRYYTRAGDEQAGAAEQTTPRHVHGGSTARSDGGGESEPSDHSGWHTQGAPSGQASRQRNRKGAGRQPQPHRHLPTHRKPTSPNPQQPRRHPAHTGRRRRNARSSGCARQPSPTSGGG